VAGDVCFRTVKIFGARMLPRACRYLAFAFFASPHSGKDAIETVIIFMAGVFV
jgi:hypothetical protein